MSDNVETLQSNLLYKQHAVETDLDASIADRIREECPKIEVQHGISADAFHRDYVQKNKPVVLRGLTDDWKQESRFVRFECGDHAGCFDE